MEDRVEGESMGRPNWNWKAFEEQCGNLLQWKLLGLYKGDSSEDSS